MMTHHRTALPNGQRQVVPSTCPKHLHPDLNTYTLTCTCASQKQKAVVSNK